MAYTTVYAPNGKKFEVASRDRADKLILEENWTQTEPVVESVEEPKTEQKKTSRRKASKTLFSMHEEVSGDPDETAVESGDET